MGRRNSYLPVPRASAVICKRSIIQSVILTVCLLASFGICSSAKAVSISFSTSSQASLPGSSVTFTGSIQNTGNEKVYLNGANVDLEGGETGRYITNVDNDFNDFPFDAPPSLSPGQVWSGILFHLMIATTTGADTYGGIFRVIGGAASSSFDNIGAASFRLTIEALPSPFSTRSLILVLLLTILFGTVILVTSLAWLRATWSSS